MQQRLDLDKMENEKFDLELKYGQEESKYNQ